MSCRRIASTSRSPARRRCGTSPTARWPAGNWPPTWCRRRWAGISCPTPSFVTDRPAAGCCSGGWTSPATRSATSPSRARTSSTCCPPATFRPAYLPVLQAYDYAGDEVTLVHADDVRLRRMAVFDVLINNADRKGGHILSGVDGSVYGVDHGVSLHVRTSCAPCCGAGPASRSTTRRWSRSPVCGEQLARRLGETAARHITRREVAALTARTVALLDDPVMPTPDRRRPIPWPAF